MTRDERDDQEYRSIGLRLPAGLLARLDAEVERRASADPSNPASRSSVVRDALFRLLPDAPGDRARGAP